MKRLLARILVRLADRLDPSPEFDITEKQWDQAWLSGQPVFVTGPPMTWTGYQLHAGQAK